MGATKRRTIYISTLILTTLYLPLARDCTKIFACDSSIIGETLIPFLSISECYQSAHIGYVIFAAIVFLVYIIWMPSLLYKVIQHKKPQPQFFDETGEYKDFTDEDYAELVEGLTTNPYKSLFEGYARRYAHYKVLTMMFKLLLTVPAALVVNENMISFGSDDTVADVLRNAIILLVCVVFTVVSMRSKPFIDGFENKMDNFTNIIEVTLAAVAVLLVLCANDANLTAFLSLCVGIIDIILVLTTIYALCRGSQWVQTRIKLLTQNLSFTMDRSTSQPLLLYRYAFVNFCKQRKVRLWCKFWDELILEDAELRIPPKEKLLKKAQAAAVKEEDTDFDSYLTDHYKPKHLEMSYAGYFAPFLMNFEGTVGERHAENKAIIQNVSMQSYKIYIDELVDKMNANPQLTRVFRTLTTVLQGKDVWWHGPAALVEKIDKKLHAQKSETETQLSNINMVESASKTHFGSLVIGPFPFMAKLTFDEGETAIFSLSPIIASRKNTAYHQMMNMIQTLVSQNDDKEVKRRKYMRLRFRAMHGHVCSWQIQRRKSKTISRTVSKTVYNSETGQNEQKQERESKQVSVLFTFQLATFTLFDASFIISLEYSDGQGSHSEAGWGNFSWNSEHYSLAGGEVGINTSYTETPTLIKFLQVNWNPNQQQFTNKIQNIKQKWHQQRRTQCTEYVAREAVLSYAFYYYVYNDDTIPYAFVHSALQCESNPKVRELCGKYNAHLNVLFNKYLKFINSGYDGAFWFLFWDDVWRHNQDVELIGENPEIFNSNLFFQQDINNDMGDMRQCIALHMHTREQLVECLDRLGLHGANTCGRKGWFNDEIIDQLYLVLDELKLWDDSDSDKNKEEEKFQQMETQIALHSPSRKAKLTDAPKYSPQEFRIKYNAASKLMQTLFRM
eukprot:71859_1